jgi:pimeloyl-ACP methyl ester carboxylesterase
MIETVRGFFEHRGLRLSYLDSAPCAERRPTVLLLHGFPDTAEMWLPQIERLHQAGYRCIAPDTLGCGRSDMAPRLGDYHALKITGDHRALLEHLGIAQAHVVGHDWGAVIGWMFAGHFPQRTLSLVAMSVGHPTAYARSGPRQKLMGWYTLFFLLGGLADRLLAGEGRLSLRRVFRGHPQMDEVLQRLREPGRMTAALRIYRAAIVPVLFTRQPQVAAPTLGLWSEGDLFLVEAQMTASARFVDGPWRYGRLHGGHWMSLEQPEHIGALILDHLELAGRPAMTVRTPR